MFLGVFDEGELSDGLGRKVDFCHTIIIATSNAGANYIKEEIEKGNSLTQNFQQNLINQLLKMGFLPRIFKSFRCYRALSSIKHSRNATSH